MVCLKCKYEWCWVCMKNFRGHNDFYNCNKFIKMTKEMADNNTNSPRKKSLISLFRRSSKKEKIREREEEREKNRIELERYLHYYHRFQNHSHSSELEKVIRQRAAQKVQEMQKDSELIASQLSYIFKGTDMLMECRNILKYTYVFAYFSFEEDANPKKELFELLQQDLEKTTENLSEVLESPETPERRLQIINLVSILKTKVSNLIVE